MTKGGYGVIHKATWLSNNETVILKRFENSKNSSKYFLNELESYRHCIDESLRGHIIKIYGFTRDPESEDYILVMKYASEGDLHKYLQKSFKNITWNNQKLRILWQISEGFSAQNLSSIIQTCSASFDYISAELELDIDTERLSSQNLSIKTQNSPTTLKKRNIEELNLETDDDNVIIFFKDLATVFTCKDYLQPDK
ncbi:hypothetical protein RhiirB3_386049 [Rhizophagus irregularis]|nr:hypothetical protein RhiirB3_386049 [Rhizophagus irregularis]